ncbi:MAG: glutaminyl-peptide cyclotransferase [Chloroflexi bacterium]|nr:glutaminyl-peptide cyclotransferase [Chloroflexota bacterium]
MPIPPQWLLAILTLAATLLARPVVQQLQRPLLMVPEVSAVYPHDTDAFTQGLVWNGSTFYESTGLYGESDVREVERDTGAVLRETPVDEAFFAEGLAWVDNRLIQITWREGTAFVYDAGTFEQTGTFSYEGEGWGLCYDGTRLIMSDGSDVLTFRDPETFKVLGRVNANLQGEPVARLNELECVGDRVYSNVWQTNFIVRINPASGTIDAVINAAALLTESEATSADVLNGIAYDADRDVFYITGKLWPKLFEVRFIEVVP